MQDAFGKCHPIVNFIYFLLVLVFSMFFMHPVCLLISLTISILYAMRISGKKAVRFNLLYMVPLMVFTVLINCLFTHQGMTTLFYLPSGNPFTLESVVYGAAASVMLIAVINWFSCLNSVLTSDKIVYLFGRVIPALSLIFSMVLRFVPKFTGKIKEIAAAQRNIGRGTGSGKAIDKIQNGITIFSIMVTWALENAIETADSMKSRGYGLPGRTAFSIFHFDKRDGWMLALILLCGAYVTVGGALGGLEWLYYPTIGGTLADLYSVSIYVIYAILCAFPLILDEMEDRKWRAMTSRI